LADGQRGTACHPADRQDPGLGDRRRRDHRGTLRATTPRLRRLHGVGPLVVVHRGLHPTPRPTAVREHAHGGVGDRPPDHGAAGGRPSDHPSCRERERRGRRPVPLYRFDPHSGLWHHARGDRGPSPRLESGWFVSGLPGPPATEPESSLARQLAEARRIIHEVETAPPTDPLRDSAVTPEFERIRWFPLPGEAVAQLRP
jgi:hypothetical protein